MDAAFKSLMTGVIDYAGFFPPASLELTEAFSKYLWYRDADDRFMLGRFICPAARISEITEQLKDVEEPVRLVIIVTETGEVGAVRGAARTSSGKFRVESVEVRLPEDAPSTPTPLVRGYLSGILQSLADGGIEPETVFFETVIREDERDRIDLLAAAAAGLGPEFPRAGLKVRCGGADPSLIPSPALLAHVISACDKAGVPFKATAGLHHPLRHVNADSGVTNHGFLNVFGAGVLAHRHALEATEIERILAEDSPPAFRFDDGVFTWGERSATAGEVAEARRALATSFGSCSFDDPREDLKGLGLLE